MMLTNKLQYGNSRDAFDPRQGLVVFRCATMQSTKQLAGPENVHHLGEDASHGQIEAYDTLIDTSRTS